MLPVRFRVAMAVVLVLKLYRAPTVSVAVVYVPPLAGMFAGGAVVVLADIATVYGLVFCIMRRDGVAPAGKSCSTSAVKGMPSAVFAATKGTM